MAHSSKTSKFDLLLIAQETEKKLKFKMEYRTSLFKKETILKMASDYIKILMSISDNMDIAIGEIKLGDIHSSQKRAVSGVEFAF